jgi:two-component system, OmpR family, response regulator
MLPKTLALIDDDAQYTEFLSHHLQERGTVVNVFGDSNLLLVDKNAYGYGFYIVDLMLPGIDGLNLIKVLRLRTSAGVLVVSGRLAPDVFEQAIGAGADMYLAKPVNFEQVAMAIEAVSRRVEMASPTHTPWKLDRRSRQLIAPDGARIDLSEGHLAVLECFSEADGEPVTRDALRMNLGRVGEADAGENLNSTIFRLRRRIEKVTSAAMPLQAKSGVGYVFRAPLKSV